MIHFAKVLGTKKSSSPTRAEIIDFIGMETYKLNQDINEIKDGNTLKQICATYDIPIIETDDVAKDILYSILF